MPIYEYKCQVCGHQFELLQKLTDEPPQVCPVCGEAQIVKLVSEPSFRLKGTGWYATDFKGGSSKCQSEGCCESGGCGGCSAAKTDQASGES